MIKCDSMVIVITIIISEVRYLFVLLDFVTGARMCALVRHVILYTLFCNNLVLVLFEFS